MSISFTKSGAPKSGAPVTVLAASKKAPKAARSPPRDDSEEEEQEEQDDDDSPRALAAKWGVSYEDDEDDEEASYNHGDDDDVPFGPDDSDDDDDSDDSEEEQGPKKSAVAAPSRAPSRSSSSPAYHEDEEEHYPADELEARCVALEQALRKRALQVKKLGALLEACSPVPGVNATRLAAAYEGEGGDLRDVKIVQLARKSRAASYALQREREEHGKTRLLLTKAEHERATLLAELEAATAAPTKGFAHQQPVSEEKSPEKPTALKPNRREQQLAKASSELRGKLQEAKDENTRLRRALQKEIGDVDDKSKSSLMLDDGWRGRAQQIVMLKARVRELEEDGSTAAPRRRDVDAAARSELVAMERERQRAVEQLTEQHAAMAGDLRDSRRKFEGAKARVEALGNELTRGKDNCRRLLEKTDADNELIDELRKELAAQRDQNRELSRRGDQQDGAQQRAANNTVELTRLRRENAKLETQLDRAVAEIRLSRDDNKKQHHHAPPSHK